MEALDINFFLSKGVSLTEQGYTGLDHDISTALKYISKKENDKMKPENNDMGNRKLTSFGSKGVNR